MTPSQAETRTRILLVYARHAGCSTYEEALAWLTEKGYVEVQGDHVGGHDLRVLHLTDEGVEVADGEG